MLNLSPMKYSEKSWYPRSEIVVFTKRLKSNPFVFHSLLPLSLVMHYQYADLFMGNLNKGEKTVTCPLRLSAFTLEKWILLNPPAEESFKPYEVFIKPEDGRVSVSLPD